MSRFCWAFILVCTACSAAAAANDIYLTDAIKNPSYLRALTSLLKNAHNLPSWTKQILKTSGNYVGDPVTYSTIDGARYELFSSCKPHDCANDQLEIMFAPGGAKAWGAYLQNGKTISYLGAPAPAQQESLKAALQQ